MKQERRLPKWANLLLKVLLIMIFPLTYNSNNLLELLNFPATGLLFTPVSNYFVRELSYFFVSTFLGTYLRNFVLGILVAFPGMYYNYKLAHVPLNRSYWKRGIGTIVAIYGLSLGLNLVLPWSQAITPGYYDYNLWRLLEKLMKYGTLVIGVFIILPLIQRQAVIIASPAAFHDYTLRQNETNPRLSITREKILGALFWFFLCFSPIFVSILQYGGSVSASGLLMSYSIGAYNYPYIDTYNLYVSFNVLNVSLIPLVALIAAFHFVFVRDVYRYIRKTITRQRLISIALFSIISPNIIAMAFTSPMYWIQVFLSIPIPILQVAGFLIIRFHRPHADQQEPYS